LKTSSSHDFKDLPARSLLTPAEVAEFFRVSPKTIYSWIDIGYLGARRFHGSVRIPVVEIIRIVGTSSEK